MQEEAQDVLGFASFLKAHGSRRVPCTDLQLGEGQDSCLLTQPHFSFIHLRLITPCTASMERKKGHGLCPPGDEDGGQMLGLGCTTPKTGCKCLGQVATAKKAAGGEEHGKSNWLRETHQKADFGTRP